MARPQVSGRAERSLWLDGAVLERTCQGNNEVSRRRARGTVPPVRTGLAERQFGRLDRLSDGQKRYASIKRSAHRSDRPKPFCAIAPGLFQTSFWGLMTHAVRAEGATPDWRSPPSVGSGPFAIAGPCARVPGRYAEPRKVKNLVAHPWSWAIGSSASVCFRYQNRLKYSQVPALFSNSRQFSHSGWSGMSD